MAFIKIENIRMAGVITCVPQQVLENANYDMIPYEERNQFISSIGIERRRVAPVNVCTSDLCEQAARHLLSQIGWNPQDIDLLVFVSQTPDYRMPATSCLLQHRLGMSTNTMTIDISQGCSGWVYGLSVLGALLSGGTIRKALLLAGNTQSKNTNVRDKSTYPLFSDAGSATAFEYDEKSNDAYMLSYKTDGAGGQTIIIPDGGYRNMVSESSFVESEFDGGLWRSPLNIKMQGDDVFAFVVSNVPKATKDLFEHFNIDIDRIDYYLLHHASRFICDKLIRKLSIPEGKAPLQLKDFGNCSNASIPLLMCTSLKTDILRRTLTLFISGFGVGMSMGVGVISINPLLCADIIEI